MEVDKQRIAELVIKYQNGDESVFNELYKLTSQRAYFVAFEFTKNEHDAEDILQESYVKALEKINELDKPESFSSWLNQIVANKSKDLLKKKKPMLYEKEEQEVFEVIPDEDTHFSPEENLDQTELQKTVMEVLDELSEEKRACVLMMYFEELSVGEIAETLEIPEGTVKTRLFSARKDLKDKFAKRGITSTFSFAPIGVVIWALRRASATVSKSFVASGTSAKVLEGITLHRAGTAATIAAGGTTTATTGTGIAAKIAALTVTQKVMAAVSVAVVVIGGTIGIVTVANDKNKKDTTSTTSYNEEFTTSPNFESDSAAEILSTEPTNAAETTTVALSVMITRNPNAATPSNGIVYSVPVSEGTPISTIVVTVYSSSDYDGNTMNLLFRVPAGEVMTESYLDSLCEKLGYNNVSDISGDWLGETAQPNEHYHYEAFDPTLTSTTARETTTVTTTNPVNTTRANVPVIGYTIPVSQGTPVARVAIMMLNADGTAEKNLFFIIPAGDVLTESYLSSLCEKLRYYNVSEIRGDAIGETAQANGIYNFEAVI